MLTTGNWPTYKVMDINLPPMMQRCVQLFQQYYNMEVNTHEHGHVQSLLASVRSFAMQNSHISAFSPSSSPPLTLSLPSINLTTQSKGTSYKRLQWTHVLGNAVVKGTFGKHSYDLQVHTLQAIALMEFNGAKPEVWQGYWASGEWGLA